MPLIIDATTDTFCPPERPNCSVMDRDPIAFFEGVHNFYFLPIIITLLVLGFYEQARLPLLNLNITWLKLQAVMFALSAVTWTLRLYFPWKIFLEQPRGSVPIYLVIPSWWQMVGFIASNDAIFAIGQGVLLRLALRQRRRVEAFDAERQPLLSQANGS
jgi:hypothetical protein